MSNVTEPRDKLIIEKDGHIWRCGAFGRFAVVATLATIVIVVGLVLAMIWKSGAWDLLGK